MLSPSFILRFTQLFTSRAISFNSLLCLILSFEVFLLSRRTLLLSRNICLLDSFFNFLIPTPSNLETFKPSLCGDLGDSYARPGLLKFSFANS